ncbi:hypothetical protein M9H77_36495 [Catharanthus roseus]|uniref:Uncharacterized protein n=1 Tax=Catharanthus roseus TaxID=4058 RepID=A0ACB9ZSU5_CATRO|nr:hypothetical protein M9H77_36495 [Catharanthus roseus]
MQISLSSLIILRVQPMAREKEVDFGEVAKVLTGDAGAVWLMLYRALFRVFCGNWLPTTNVTTVLKERAHLRYAFATKKKINICTVIFKNIHTQIDQNKASKITLPCPYLITEYLLDGTRDHSCDKSLSDSRMNDYYSYVTNVNSFVLGVENKEEHILGVFENKGKSLENGHHILQEETTMSFSLNPSILYYEFSFKELNLLLESHSFHEQLVGIEINYELFCYNIELLNDDLVIESMIPSVLYYCAFMCSKGGIFLESLVEGCSAKRVSWFNCSLGDDLHDTVQCDIINHFKCIGVDSMLLECLKEEVTVIVETSIEDSSVGSVVSSEEDAFKLYNDHAFRLGFSVHKRNQKFKAGCKTKYLKNFYYYKQGIKSDKGKGKRHMLKLIFLWVARR